jgi:hypothetical protein
MSPIISVKNDVSYAKKNWYMQKPKTPVFKKINNHFISFWEKSGVRTCDCKSYPTFVEKDLPDGKHHITTIACKECHGTFYKHEDFHGVVLILARKGGGKTTFVFQIADLIHQIDKHRKIKLWQCPDQLIIVLHNLKICTYYKVLCETAMGEARWKMENPIFNHRDYPTPKAKKPNNTTQKVPHTFQEKEIRHRVCTFSEYGDSTECLNCKHCRVGKKYFFKINELSEAEYNDVIVIDEGIISVNAKEALSKTMRKWDKFMAVVRHKRIILFCLFQRFEVIKAMREMSDMIVYKSLPRKLIENEKTDYIIKNYGDILTKLEKWEAIISSDHDKFRMDGKFVNKVPFWFNKDVSMSYSADTSFLEDESKIKHQNERAEMMAEWLQENYPVPIEGYMGREGAKSELRHHFEDLKPELTATEINMAIQDYCNIMNKTATNEEEETMERIQSALLTNESNAIEQLAHGKITEKKLRVFYEVCKNGRSMTDFEDDGEDGINMDRQTVSRVVREIGAYFVDLFSNKNLNISAEKQGIEAERYIVRENWEKGGYGMRAVGSGGTRHGIPTPDNFEITEDGKLRVIQVKERDLKKNVTFSPLTFNSEIMIYDRLLSIAKKSKAVCPHCLEKVPNVIKIDKPHIYLLPKNHEKIIKHPINVKDNKKTIKYNIKTGKFETQDPDMDKITSKKVKEFLESNDDIYTGEKIEIEDVEDIDKDVDEENNDKKKKQKESVDYVDFDKLLEEHNIES